MGQRKGKQKDCIFPWHLGQCKKYTIHLHNMQYLWSCCGGSNIGGYAVTQSWGRNFHVRLCRDHFRNPPVGMKTTWRRDDSPHNTVHKYELGKNYHYFWEGVIGIWSEFNATIRLYPNIYTITPLLRFLSRCGRRVEPDILISIHGSFLGWNPQIRKPEKNSDWGDNRVHGSHTVAPRRLICCTLTLLGNSLF